MTNKNCAETEGNMRWLRRCGIRKPNLRLAFLIGIPLLLLIILKIGIYVQKVDPNVTPNEVEDPMEEITDKVFSRNPPVDKNPQEWRVGSAERERMLQWIKRLEKEQADKAKQQAANVKEEGVKFNPGEQMLVDDVLDNAPKLAEISINPPTEKPGKSIEENKEENKPKLDDRNPKVQPNHGQGFPDSDKMNVQKHQNGDNGERIPGREQQEVHQIVHHDNGLDDNNVHHNVDVDDRKRKGAVQSRAAADVRQAELEEVFVNHDKVEQAAANKPGINEMELDINDIKYIKNMHSTPPWLKLQKPLRFEDYASNCSQGSFPEPGSSFRTKKFCLVDDQRRYFGKITKDLCYYKGTDVEKSKRLRSPPYCECYHGWHGRYCSLPDVVFKGGYPYEYGFDIHSPPRRIIYAFPFNGEFDMLETTLMTLGDVVDVFLILESNFTAAGQPKDRFLLKALQNNQFQEIQHKIVYISLDYFPRVAYTDGWAADALLRNHIGRIAFGGVLENVRDDDIIVSLDADEIVQPDTLMFLKLHYGYPEPFGFVLKHSVYGYFWKAVDEVTTTYGGCRVSMLRDILGGNLYDVRNAPKNVLRDGKLLDKFKRRTGTRVKPWVFGSPSFPAGWHCSWCFQPIGIQYKLISAHASDFPRWGTFPDKTNLPFIAKLVETGLWFDEKTHLQSNNFYDDSYAPHFVISNKDRFGSLLNHTVYMQGSQRSLQQKENQKQKTFNGVGEIV